MAPEWQSSLASHGCARDRVCIEQHTKCYTPKHHRYYNVAITVIVVIIGVPCFVLARRAARWGWGLYNHKLSHEERCMARARRVRQCADAFEVSDSVGEELIDAKW